MLKKVKHFIKKLIKYSLCFMFYVLCFMFYVLCFMFYVLCFNLYIKLLTVWICARDIIHCRYKYIMSHAIFYEIRFILQEETGCFAPRPPKHPSVEGNCDKKILKKSKKIFANRHFQSFIYVKAKYALF